MPRIRMAVCTEPKPLVEAASTDVVREDVQADGPASCQQVADDRRADAMSLRFGKDL